MAKPKQERNTKENKKLQIGLVILIMKRGSHVGWTQIFKYKLPLLLKKFPKSCSRMFEIFTIFYLLGMIYIWRPWKLSNFQDPPPSTPFSLEVKFQTTPTFPNNNQSTKTKHEPRMTIICPQVLPSGRISFSISTY